MLRLEAKEDENGRKEKKRLEVVKKGSATTSTAKRAARERPAISRMLAPLAAKKAMRLESALRRKQLSLWAGER